MNTFAGGSTVDVYVCCAAATIFGMAVVEVELGVGAKAFSFDGRVLLSSGLKYILNTL